MHPCHMISARRAWFYHPLKSLLQWQHSSDEQERGGATQTCTMSSLSLFPCLSAACEQGTALPGPCTDDQAHVSNEPNEEPGSSSGGQ